MYGGSARELPCMALPAAFLTEKCCTGINSVLRALGDSKTPLYCRLGELLRACYYAIDKKPITDIKLSFKEKMLLKVVMKKAKGTDVELLLKESGLIE